LTRRLVLLRHGQTAWNASGRAQGHTDISLDDVGRAQAAAAAPYLAALRPARLWSSDLARASETAAYVAEAAGLPVDTDARLREYDVGARSGLTLAEFEASYPAEYAAWLTGNQSRLVPGAESMKQVQERILPALRDCLDALVPGQTGIVVTHGASLKVGLFALLGWPDELSRTVRGMDNCGWAVLGEHDVPGRLRLVSYNETAAVGQHPERAAGADFASDDAVG
jgi:broad specificity phosphatase PhoE